MRQQLTHPQELIGKTIESLDFPISEGIVVIGFTDQTFAAIEVVSSSEDEVLQVAERAVEMA